MFPVENVQYTPPQGLAFWDPKSEGTASPYFFGTGSCSVYERMFSWYMFYLFSCDFIRIYSYIVSCKSHGAHITVISQLFHYSKHRFALQYISI